MRCAFNQEDVLADLVLERNRQDAKFPHEDNQPKDWLTILAEEFGEVARAILTEGTTEYRTELIQLAAVAVAAVEDLDRKTSA